MRRNPTENIEEFMTRDRRKIYIMDLPAGEIRNIIVVDKKFIAGKSDRWMWKLKELPFWGAEIKDPDYDTWKILKKDFSTGTRFKHFNAIIPGKNLLMHIPNNAVFLENISISTVSVDEAVHRMEYGVNDLQLNGLFEIPYGTKLIHVHWKAQVYDSFKEVEITRTYEIDWDKKEIKKHKEVKKRQPRRQHTSFFRRLIHYRQEEKTEDDSER